MNARLTVGSFLLIAVLAHSAGSEGVNFNVPPGPHVLALQTTGPAPLYDLRFIFGGNPDVRITRIQGVDGSPEYVFPDATPAQVTRWFAQNPISASSSINFNIEVDNTSASTHTLVARAVWGRSP